MDDLRSVRSALKVKITYPIAKKSYPIGAGPISTTSPRRPTSPSHFETLQLSIRHRILYLLE
ncbi:hypothetical protein OUZ56_012735 [Daphnia magna]|uniref:Uncharacterized protein n=1 Tax=Daphnia magna TaxID=35525 RepID=A0ABQ9Z3X3_9CRUS|nr:hypothetical protein OUZ56_012735 [Daphnia magna]